MNGIENIRQKIFEDARIEAEKLLGEARAEADKLRGEILAGADADAKAIVAAAAEAEAGIRRQQEGASELESRKILLAAKHEAINNAFAEAMKQLLALENDEYVLLCARVAANAAVSGKEQLILSRTDHDTRGAAIAERTNAILRKYGRHAEITLSEETREIGGGVVLRDGPVETNCSFAALIEASRKEITDEVAGVLFPK